MTRCGVLWLVHSLAVSACLAEQVTVRLVGGRGQHEGNVNVKRGTHWGLVCDDGWNARAGNVICRQLGFPGLQRVTKFNYFNASRNGMIFLDDVKCRGFEQNLGACRHAPWKRHNCELKEAAGVICKPNVTAPAPVSTPARSPLVFSTTASPAPPVEQLFEREDPQRTIRPAYAPRKSIHSLSTNNTRIKMAVISDEAVNPRESPSTAPRPINPEAPTNRDQARIKSIELLGGRNPSEGYVNVHLSNSAAGTICPTGWGLPEAMVVCRELGLKFADRGTSADFFRGGDETMVLQRVHCEGDELRLADCQSSTLTGPCMPERKVAGVICTDVLSDLLPNVTALVNSVYVQDRYLAYLTCALEENCLSSSAYSIKETHPRNWNYMSRRLLRFSSSIANIGTSDFRPRQHRNSWEWHSCHMHYHSMDVFTHYDVLDRYGNRVAEGHKASFCLEDVECQEGYKKKYSCRGQGNQGISVGCSDVYKHDIDCQWIDITDLSPGQYVFKLNVNPDRLVPELSFENNAAICDLTYSGSDVKMENCENRRG
ncbi:lysyl oxidase homolog 3B-like [Watersipora subatra]|uniref:lysyl oxidase homolog 3B-like n=1 Tax=Watersipora subatra TaxID=2589382 RepID=UPI00355C13C7